MNTLPQKNVQLQRAIQEYPELVQSLINFITQDAPVRILTAGGQMYGVLTFQVVKGEVVSFTPAMEMKVGKEL